MATPPVRAGSKIQRSAARHGSQRVYRPGPLPSVIAALARSPACWQAIAEVRPDLERRDFETDVAPVPRRNYRPRWRIHRATEISKEGATAETATNHEKIRTWAEKHGGKPAAVDCTHKDDDVGIVRLMFPRAPHSEHVSLVPISWDEFFEEFDKKRLALICEPDSNFNKQVARG